VKKERSWKNPWSFFMSKDKKEIAKRYLKIRIIMTIIVKSD